MNPQFYNRDLSWLSFNGRILMEAARKQVPLMERIKFLSIYSSNLDEFYRVRMPVVMAMHKLAVKQDEGADIHAAIILQAQQMVQQQLVEFGRILTTELLPLLQDANIHLVYKEAIPEIITSEVTNYFFSQVLAYIQPVQLTTGAAFFPENNKLYLLVRLKTQADVEETWVVNIPSDVLPRFYTIAKSEVQYIVFLDDIIRMGFAKLSKPEHELAGTYSFKVTRDAEIDFKDEYISEVSEDLEKQLARRDYGLATRFLYQPGLPLRLLYSLQQQFNLPPEGAVEGGIYHNLKDLADLPVKRTDLSYPSWPGLYYPDIQQVPSLLDYIAQKDVFFHAPYQSYDTILRFFNEAAIRPEVTEIYISLYRVASDSRIVNALISAAKNGKKVQVMVELKARFDEANNIKWAKKLKAAGVKIIYSPAALKVHAKIGLIKLQMGRRVHYQGILASGNFNEATARFYTDHILLTANKDLLSEIELLFIFLAQKAKKVDERNFIPFKHLLVAQFNLQQEFISLIEQEIANAQQGLPAKIIIKLNNLEERVLIRKLYEASEAGVQIELIVRSICCLIPGVKGMSSNIRITRIVDRYLEHGRIFIFHNNGDQQVYLGSADWMNRNIYHRIEVCFPVYDQNIKKEILDLIHIQLADNVQAVTLNQQLGNEPVIPSGPAVRSQQQIYELLKQNAILQPH
ncbi:RNA degradosome polyphosphate kinase [Mucilaginibacter koreensis]